MDIKINTTQEAIEFIKKLLCGKEICYSNAESRVTIKLHRLSNSQKNEVAKQIFSWIRESGV